MSTALDAPLDVLNPSERSFVEKVRQYGWFGTHVAEEVEKPGFSYSTGFWITTQKPEWIIFDLRREIAHQIIWDRFREAQSCDEVAFGKKIDSILVNNPVYIFPVANRYYASYLGWNRWFYGGNDFPCLQIIWPDRADIFPWESDFDAALCGRQPDLTEYGWRAALVE